MLEGDLKSAHGHIPASAVTVNRITYGVRGSRKRGLEKSIIVPWIVRKSGPIRLTRGWSVRYWVTLKVPPGTKAGTYEGNLAFKVGGERKRKIPIECRVLPFTLLDNPSVGRGFFYFMPRWYVRYGFEGIDERLWKAIGRDLNLLKAYGFNSIDMRGLVTPVIRNGEVYADFSKADRFWRLYRDIGLKGQAICSDGTVGTGPLRGRSPFGLPGKLPYRSYREKEALKKTIALFRDHARVNDWPGAPRSLLFWCTDELGTHTRDNVDLAIDLLELYRQVPGIRTFSTINTEKELRMLPFLDMVAVNVGVRITGGLIEKIRRSGTRLGFFNIGGSRYAFGFYLWRTGADLYLQWHWNDPKQDPFVFIDGSFNECSFSYQTEDDIYSTYRLELAREGVDDFRYALTLERLLDRSRSLSSRKVREASEAAEKALARLRGMCNVEINRVFDGVETWSSRDFRHAREMIIRAILGLLEAGVEMPVK